MKAKKSTVLKGGKRDFAASALAVDRNVKRVKSMSTTAVPDGRKILKRYTTPARGRHGKAFDLIVFEGPRVRRLVVKKYNLRQFSKGETQSTIAEKEFKTFQKLKKNGFHVPSTIRIAEINGEKHVALTDLTKIGDLRAKSFSLAKRIAEKFGIEGNAIEEVKQYVEKETNGAKELGLDLNDAWEFLIDTKEKKITAFILDLSINIK